MYLLQLSRRLFLLADLVAATCATRHVIWSVINIRIGAVGTLRMIVSWQMLLRK
jgi:hypothetical protein